jgi:hypothetical protein
MMCESACSVGRVVRRFSEQVGNTLGIRLLARPQHDCPTVSYALPLEPKNSWWLSHNSYPGERLPANFSNCSPIVGRKSTKDSKNSPIGQHLAGQQEVTMDLKDRRLWYGVVVIVVLIVIAYAAGWFGGTPTPVPPQ